MVRPLPSVDVRPADAVPVRGAAGPVAVIQAERSGEGRSVGLLALLAAGSAAVWFVPMRIDPPARHALAIGVFMIGAWMTQVLDYGIAGILGCFLFWMFGVAKFETAFSGCVMITLSVISRSR